MMADPMATPSTPMLQDAQDSYFLSTMGSTSPRLGATSSSDSLFAMNSPSLPSTPGPSILQESEDPDFVPPLDRLTVFDFLENLMLPQRLEKIQTSINAQAERVKKQQAKLKETSKQARERVVDQWRKRVPDPDERLKKYRKAMRSSIDRIGIRWDRAKKVTASEKTSFVAGVLNIFISGYLIGAYPEWFHIWYSAQVFYFYPLRWVKYHRIGYHYFLADLCYFVNLLLVLSIWAFPHSKRLLISTFCLAYGNNAVAIAMWRNSLVFHSMDKVVSLFIHVMPCVTLHCMVHLYPLAMQKDRFPAIYEIKTSPPSSPQHYGLASMAMWSTVPYSIWQLAYHTMITVRRADEIAKGRPTSFTWLRKSYARTWLGKIVLARPEYLQEPTFMLIQYTYALLTMAPAPIWFWYRWPSAAFLMIVFTWSVYNGAVYYVDVFGKRFQKELEQLKRDVAKWQASPELAPKSPVIDEVLQKDLQMTSSKGANGGGADFSLGAAAIDESLVKENGEQNGTAKTTSVSFHGGVTPDTVKQR